MELRLAALLKAIFVIMGTRIRQVVGFNCCLKTEDAQVYS